MKEPVKNIDLEKKIFHASPSDFRRLALAIFQFQYSYNDLYRKYCDALNIEVDRVAELHQIPFLPISFFRSHWVKTTEFEPEAVFESSGTTQQVKSRHAVKFLSLYRKSFTLCFERFYGPASGKCILGLMPAYTERKHSSLAAMADDLIRASHHELSGFYLHDPEKLHRTLLHNEILKLPTMLMGVTYALLDFAEAYPMQLRHTVIIETGGMKGRREEMTRQQVHGILQKQLGVNLVHSEYGMTELLSQAWSKGDGIFHCAPWMKVLIRDEDDPLHVTEAKKENTRTVKGAINVIDLANIYSCAFIATDDVGSLNANGSFEVLGRLDNSEMRGCSLMAI